MLYNIIRFKVAGETFKQTFWVTEKIEEDVFFGIPALREMSASINVANLDDDEGDYLVLRKTGTKVPLDHFPSGMTSGVLSLSTEEPFTLKPFTGATKELVLRPGKGFMWPEGKSVTCHTVTYSMVCYLCQHTVRERGALQYRLGIYDL